MTKKLVLSLFPGIDLFGRGFELQGFCVVRGPDLLYGQDVRSFAPPRNTFEGVIAGSPCPDFSRLRRCPPSGYGVEMLREFVRCVSQAGPVWFVLENVPGVPDVAVPGYQVQRFNLTARECGLPQNRLRAFQFGSVDGSPLVLDRVNGDFPLLSRCCLATESSKTDRRTFPDFCALMGLPRTFDLPGLSRKAKYAAVGNGVPVPMARVVAAAIDGRSASNGGAIVHLPLWTPRCRQSTHGNPRVPQARAT